MDYTYPQDFGNYIYTYSYVLLGIDKGAGIIFIFLILITSFTRAGDFAYPNGFRLFA